MLFKCGNGEREGREIVYNSDAAAGEFLCSGFCEMVDGITGE